MAIVIDILFITLFVFCVVRHLRLGFACSVLNAGKLIISLLSASFFCRSVALVLYELGVSESLSVITAFVLIFFVTLFSVGIIIKLISKIEVPIITRIDKFLGAILGAMLGMLSVLISATILYTLLELVSSLTPVAMSVYDNSYVFKFVYDLNIFEFIRNIF